MKHAFNWIVIALSVSFTGADAANMATPVEEFNEGMRCASNHHAAQAVDCFTRAIAVSPNMWTAYIQRALAYKQLKAYDKARRDIEHAVPLNTAGAYHMLYAIPDSSFKKKAWNSAIGEYTDYLSVTPQALMWYPLKQRGSAYSELEQNEAAVQDLTKAETDKHSFHSALPWRARTYVLLHHFEKAASDLVLYLQINATGPGSRELLAEAYAMQGKFPQCTQVLSQTLEPDPGVKCILDNKTTAQFYERAYDAALKQSHRLADSDPGNAQLHTAYGLCLFLQKQYPAALQQLNQAIKINPKFTEAYNLRSNILARMGKIPAALADANTAISLDPHSMSNYILLDGAHFWQGDRNKTIEDLDARITRDAKNPIIYIVRAHVCAQIRDNKAAVKDLNTALKLDPNLLSALVARAQLLQAENRTSEAVTDLTRAISISPVDPLLLRARASCFYELKMYAKAADDLTKVIQIDNDPDVHSARANCYDMLGKADLASADRLAVAFFYH